MIMKIQKREIEMINDNDEMKIYEQATPKYMFPEQQVQFAVLGGRGVSTNCGFERTHSLFSSFPRKHNTFQLLLFSHFPAAAKIFLEKKSFF